MTYLKIVNDSFRSLFKRKSCVSLKFIQAFSIKIEIVICELYSEIIYIPIKQINSCRISYLKIFILHNDINNNNIMIYVI